MYDRTRHHGTTSTDAGARLGLPADATLLGTDGRKAAHYYSETANTIVVVDSADLIGQRWSPGEHSLTTSRRRDRGFRWRPRLGDRVSLSTADECA